MVTGAHKHSATVWAELADAENAALLLVAKQLRHVKLPSVSGGEREARVNAQEAPVNPVTGFTLRKGLGSVPKAN